MRVEGEGVEWGAVLPLGRPSKLSKSPIRAADVTCPQPLLSRALTGYTPHTATSLKTTRPSHFDVRCFCYARVDTSTVPPDRNTHSVGAGGIRFDKAVAVWREVV